MSWLTTCPHCGTTFRVSQQQLDAYQGDVRCGKCQRVFNAAHSLKTEAVAPVESPAEEIAVETAEESSSHSNEKVESAVEETGVSSAEAEEVAESEPAIVVDEIVADEGKVTEELAVSAEAKELATPTEPQSEPETEEAESEPEQATPAVEETPPEEAAKPRRLGWLWGLGSLILAVLLGAQVLYIYRAEIAARSPGIQPLLTRMCDVLQCRVGLPRHIELLGIDSSDLQADPQRANVLILNATLRSRAQVSQEYPLLELTLTDASDQALLRRVFVPAEYLPKGKDVAAGIPASGEVAIKLNLQVRDLQPVGYRLYLFYPKAG